MRIGRYQLTLGVYRRQLCLLRGRGKSTYIILKTILRRISFLWSEPTMKQVVGSVARKAPWSFTIQQQAGLTPSGLEDFLKSLFKGTHNVKILDSYVNIIVIVMSVWGTLVSVWLVYINIILLYIRYNFSINDVQLISHYYVLLRT